MCSRMKSAGWRSTCNWKRSGCNLRCTGRDFGMPGKMLTLLDHRTALRISSNVTRNIRQLQGRTKVDIGPREVIKILNKARIKFTLVGAHGIAGWLVDPRASQDVDVIVHAQHKKAVQAVRKVFPDLRVTDVEAVTRFIDPATDRPVIDLMKPD